MKSNDLFPGSSKLVEGTIPFSSMLLMGPSGIGKTIFSQQFAYAGLLKGESCIYLSTDQTPEEIYKSMKMFGFDVETFVNNDTFRVVDCYSWKLDHPPASKYLVSNPSNFMNVLKAVDEARGVLKNVRFILDSVTGLTSICEHSVLEIVRFLQVLVGKIRSSESNAIFIVVPEAHDSHLVNHLRLIFDGLLEMKEDESEEQIKRLFRIFSLKGAQHQTMWTTFEITNNGIMLKREDQLRCEMCSALIEWKPHEELIADERHIFDKPECANTYRRLKGIYGESFK